MKPEASYEAFQDHGGEWRWRIVASNGEVVADSGEGYSTKANLVRAMRRHSLLVMAAASNLPVIVQNLNREI